MEPNKTHARHATTIRRESVRSKKKAKLTLPHLAVGPPLDAVLPAQPLNDGRRDAHHLAHFLDRVLKIPLEVSQGHPLAEAPLGPLVLEAGDIIVVVVFVHPVAGGWGGRGAVDGFHGRRGRANGRLIAVMYLLEVQL